MRNRTELIEQKAHIKEFLEDTDRRTKTRILLGVAFKHKWQIGLDILDRLALLRDIDDDGI